MTPTLTNALTAAFKAGEAARVEGKGFSTRLTIAKGRARDYWEAGWHKADKAARAAYAAPEAVAARAAADAADREWQRSFMQDVMVEMVVSLHTGRL